MTENLDERKLMQVIKNGDAWKIKYSKGTAVYTFESSDVAQPELKEEMYKLHGYAFEMTDYIDASYREKTLVCCVEFDWKGDDPRRNAQVTFQITSKPIKIKSPKLLADKEMDEAKKDRWKPDMIDQLDRFAVEAFKYVDGARTQAELPLLPKADGEQGEFADDELDEVAA